jgi:hypothetical protein
MRKGGRRDALLNPQTAARLRAYLEAGGHGNDSDGRMFQPLKHAQRQAAGRTPAHRPRRVTLQYDKVIFILTRVSRPKRRSANGSLSPTIPMAGCRSVISGLIYPMPRRTSHDRSSQAEIVAANSRGQRIIAKSRYTQPLSLVCHSSFSPVFRWFGLSVASIAIKRLPGDPTLVCFRRRHRIDCCAHTFRPLGALTVA